MGTVMKSDSFIQMAKDIATKYKTLYVYGCFGAPMNDKNKKRYTQNNAYNKQASRTKKIKAASSDTFGFDCVCLIKGILWGWNGDVNKTYGGAVYASNGVPDTNASGMMNYCSNVSTNFKNIIPGELVYMPGHIGIYIGDGLAVECTPIWKDGVQITAVGNIGKKSGYNTRTWTKHGKCNFIDYTKPEPEPTPQPTPTNFKVGDKVVPIELVNYNGTHLIQYDPYYFITELKGDRAVLSALRDNKYYVWAAMNTNNIRKVD